MQKQKKLSARILSLVLTAAMVLTTFPATTFAVGDDTSAGGSATLTTQKRTTPLDLATNADITYIDAGGSSKTANPTTTSITDTGEGWSWDLTSKTLTLSGATIDCSGNYADSGDTFGIQLLNDHNIFLTEGTTNTVKASDSSAQYHGSYGVYFANGDGAPSISGTGTLDTMSGEVTGEGSLCCGIYCKDPVTLTISDATIIAASANNVTFGSGIWANLNVQSGTITAIGTGTRSVYGIYSNKEMTMTGGTLSASGSTNAVECTGNPIIAEGATVTNGKADNSGGEFKSGTTKKLRHIDTTKPVVISLTSSVSFDARNGVAIPDAEVGAGGTITMPAAPRWTGYTFDGWYTGIDGAETELANSGLTASTTVYAKWTKDGKTVRTTPLDLTATSVTPAPDQGWTWDSVAKKLTLNGANINVGDAAANESYRIKAINLPAGVTVEVNGQNSLCAESALGTNSTFGIYSNADGIIINGTGSLDLKLHDNGNGYGCGIQTKSLAIDGSLNVNITGDVGYGIKADNSLIITGGTISVQTTDSPPPGGAFSILMRTGAITAVGATVTGEKTDNSTGKFVSGVTTQVSPTAKGGTVKISFTKPLVEQFKLPLGGTYYFDLSGEAGNIGTINAAVPDATLHYVPFTYAGTVNAYSLHSRSDVEVSNTDSVTADANTSDPNHAIGYKSDRSLFVADYTVSQLENWEYLNTANLIFGKTFDTNYKLRSLSMGSNSTGENATAKGTPEANEWDRILTKSGLTNPIKHCSSTWSAGQDTRSGGNMFQCVARGEAGIATKWDFFGTTYTGDILGWRPAIEVLNPATLTANGLKAVTLNLNSGTFNSSAESIQIVCAGGTFKAPSGEGLTPPADKILDRWSTAQDGTGTSYAVGAAVPNSVTTLYAQWAAPSRTVTFDARNGVAIQDAKIDKGTEKVTNMPANPTWTGYTFGGWYTGIDGAGTEFVNSGLTANTTVYAKWTKDGITVRTTPLDLRGISSTTNSKEGWAWDSTNKTLTLSGAQIFGTGEGYGIMLPTNSKIVLSEGTTSNVTGGSELYLMLDQGSNSRYGSFGIFCETTQDDNQSTPEDGKLTITGTGKLVATGGDLSAYTEKNQHVSSGIGSTIHITVEGADVTATGGKLSPYTDVDDGLTRMSAGMYVFGGVIEINGAAKVIATGAGCDTHRESFGISGVYITIKDSADVTAIGGSGKDTKGIDSLSLTMTGGTLSASGAVAISARPITAAGATVTNGTANNGSFVSGTTNTLTQTDATQPVVIKFTNSVTFDARNGVAIKDADIDKDTSKITALPTAPTWEGYKFAGWYTGIDGAGTEFVNSGLTANTTVYAKWTATNGNTVRTTPLDLLADTVTAAADQGWTWDADTSILTLSGATIDCSGNPSSEDGSVFGIQLMTDYDIVLTNGTTNTVKAGDSSYSMSMGVRFMVGNRSATGPSISGKGTLYAMGGVVAVEADTGSFGIFCMDATLTFSDATVYASSKSSIGCGIAAYLDVQSGTITAIGTGTSTGFGINTPSMTMSGGTVTAIGSGNAEYQQSGYGIIGGSLEMTGGALSASGNTAAIAVEAMEAGEVATITAAKATVTGAKETFESGITATLTQSGTDPVVISFIPKISFDARNGALSENAEIGAGGTITMPADPTWEGYTFAGWYTGIDGAGTAFANNGLTDSATVYAKWTKGGKSVRTTPLDFTNATTNLEGDGWTWDNTGKTLTLSGLTLNSAKLDEDSSTGIRFPDAACTIILVDDTENTVDVSLAKNSTGSWGIFAPNQLTIKTSGNGIPGKLNAIAGNASGASVGIYANGGIVIESGKITATAGSSESDNSIGISADSGDIHIKGGTVNATGGKSGATGMAGSFGLYGTNVQIDDGTVTAKGGEATLSAGIVGGAYVKLNGGMIHAMGTTAAVAALYNDVVIGGGIANVKVNDESATIAKKTIGEMTISTLLTTEAAIITDAAIKFKPNYTGTNPLAPNAFQAIRTHSSITLPSQTITGETVEYGIENPDGSIAWQDNPTFSGLNPDTQYKFYTRVKGNDTHKAGTTSDATTIKTKKSPTTVSGNVTDSKGAAVSGATVTLTPSAPALKTTTDESGNYSISNVPEGVYSLIITKDDLTITETVTVDGTPVTGKNIKLLAGTKNTVVESTPGTPEISAGDVNELLNDTNIGTTLTEPEKELVENKGGSVEIKVKADLKTGDQLAADKSQIESIAGNQKIDLLLDLSVLKTVKDSSGKTVTDGEKITKLANIIKIRLPIPADLQGKADLSLYRIHDGKPEKLSKDVAKDGEYYTIDDSGEFMTLYLKNFSTYALGYNAFTLTIVDGGTGVSGKGNYANGDTVTINAGSKGGYSFNGWTVTTGTVTLANPSSASTTFIMTSENVTLTAGWTYTGGGGGGGGTTTYPNSVNKPENGTVSMNPASPSKGQTVTITTKPDDGYVVKTIIVKDADGKTIAVTEKGENSYTFTQPKGKVTLAVTYAKAGDIYTDMLPTDWFYDAVTKATVNGWFKGTSDTTFSPYASTARGMIATILHRMEGAPQANTTSFNDVAADAYYANAIAWAQANNIVSGYGNGNYGPNDNVTREQLATILHRYATYKGYDVSKTAAFDSFADSKNVSAYAKEAMSWAVGNGLISGRDNNTLTPTETATRAELAVILVRFAELSK